MNFDYIVKIAACKQTQLAIAPIIDMKQGASGSKRTATKAPNKATVEESWMTAEELLSVFDGSRGFVVFDG